MPSHGSTGRKSSVRGRVGERPIHHQGPSGQPTASGAPKLRHPRPSTNQTGARSRASATRFVAAIQWQDAEPDGVLRKQPRGGERDHQGRAGDDGKAAHGRGRPARARQHEPDAGQQQERRSDRMADAHPKERPGRVGVDPAQIGQVPIEVGRPPCREVQRRAARRSRRSGPVRPRRVRSDPAAPQRPCFLHRARSRPRRSFEGVRRCRVGAGSWRSWSF